MREAATVATSATHERGIVATVADVAAFPKRKVSKLLRVFRPITFADILRARVRGELFGRLFVTAG